SSEIADNVWGNKGGRRCYRRELIGAVAVKDLPEGNNIRAPIPVNVCDGERPFRSLLERNGRRGEIERAIVRPDFQIGRGTAQKIEHSFARQIRNHERARVSISSELKGAVAQVEIHRSGDIDAIN